MSHSLIPDALDIFPQVDGRWRQIADTRHADRLGEDVDFRSALALRKGEALRRAELEARILADQPGDEIAAAMAEPVGVINLYEHWFFDVRSRLEQCSWIFWQAIGRDPSGVLGPDEIAPFWRWIGYHLGLLALEPLLKAVSRETLQREGIDAYLKAETPLDREFKFLIAVERLPIPQTKAELLRLCHIWDEQRPACGSATTALDALCCGSVIPSFAQEQSPEETDPLINTISPPAISTAA